MHIFKTLKKILARIGGDTSPKYQYEKIIIIIIILI